MDGLEFMDTSQNTIALGFKKQNLYKTLMSANFKSKYAMASSIGKKKTNSHIKPKLQSPTQLHFEFPAFWRWALFESFRKKHKFAAELSRSLELGWG